MTIIEEWRPIEGYIGYEVSNLGRVRSWRRRGGWNQTTDLSLLVGEPRLLIQSRTTRGYLSVGLTYDTERKRTCSVHALVAAAFIGARPEGYQVCHNDNNPQNNRADNLRYGTPWENMHDQIGHGTSQAARQRAKTHCKWGHEYTEDNTAWEVTRYGQSRRCRICRKINAVRANEFRNARNRAARNGELPQVS